MRFSFCCAMFLSAGCAVFLAWCCAGFAAEPTRSPVFCTPLERDHRSDERDDYPNDPRPVVLMVKGKFVRPAGYKPLPLEQRGRVQERIDLHVDEVLFGPHPGQVVPFWGSGYWDEIGKTGYCSFVCISHQGKPYFDLDTYYFGRRHLEANEQQAAAAIARARLDTEVLGCEAVFVGKPIPAAATKSAARPRDKNAEEIPAEIRGLYLRDWSDEKPVAQSQEVQIERVLHGSLPVGKRIAVQISQPLPLSGDGSRLYFVSRVGPDVLTCSTCWDLHLVDQVTTSLQRRTQYPVSGSRQEIVFLGSIDEARDLLASHSRFAQRLAERRLELLGGEQIPSLVAAIEKNLLASELHVPIGWEHQKKMIEQLAEAEDHRTDGQIVRLANLMLKRAEAGENFPVPPETSADEDEIDAIRRRRLKFHYHLSAGNHSLAWLINSLKPDDAARLFCERLKKLRDLTSYGWKEEATGLLETLHLEDRLALPPLLVEGAKLKPRVWQARWPQPLLVGKKIGPPAKLTPAGRDPFGVPPGGDPFAKDPFCTPEEPPTEAPPDPFAPDKCHRFAELISGYAHYDEDHPFSLKQYPHGVEAFEYVTGGNELRVRSQYGSEIVWSVATGKEARTEHGELQKHEFWSPPDRRSFRGVAHDCDWSIVLREQPYRYKGERYGPPAAAAIVVSSPDQADEEIEEVYDDDEPIPGARGQVRLFGYQEHPPFGLIAARELFFIGTNIFRCRDLKPISFANVQGRLLDVVPAANGERYALLIHVEGTGTVVRIHDVDDGATLFALPVKEDVVRIAFSPNGRQVAAITKEGKVLVWGL